LRPFFLLMFMSFSFREFSLRLFSKFPRPPFAPLPLFGLPWGRVFFLLELVLEMSFSPPTEASFVTLFLFPFSSPDSFSLDPPKMSVSLTHDLRTLRNFIFLFPDSSFFSLLFYPDSLSVPMWSQVSPAVNFSHVPVYFLLRPPPLFFSFRRIRLLSFTFLHPLLSSACQLSFLSFLLFLPLVLPDS